MAPEGAGSAADQARDLGRAQLERLGRLIREQRNSAKMSLRDLASLTDVSNPYLSQVERGLHAPSVRVLRSIAAALNMSAETLLVQAGLIDPAPDEPSPSVATAIRADDRLTDDQKAALLAVYRSYLAAGAPAAEATGPSAGRRAEAAEAAAVTEPQASEGEPSA